MHAHFTQHFLSCGSDDGDDLAAAVTATPMTTREGLLAIDPVLCGVIERARLAVAEGARARAVFKYDVNSRCLFPPECR